MKRIFFAFVIAFSVAALVSAQDMTVEEAQAVLKDFEKNDIFQNLTAESYDTLLTAFQTAHVDLFQGILAAVPEASKAVQRQIQEYKLIAFLTLLGWRASRFDAYDFYKVPGDELRFSVDKQPFSIVVENEELHKAFIYVIEKAYRKNRGSWRPTLNDFFSTVGAFPAPFAQNFSAAVAPFLQQNW
jgi:hypothetical protein